MRTIGGAFDLVAGVPVAGRVTSGTRDSPSPRGKHTSGALAGREYRPVCWCHAGTHCSPASPRRPVIPGVAEAL
eukprot:7667071-Pyramimonas_sp.AAC.1